MKSKITLLSTLIVFSIFNLSNSYLAQSQGFTKNATIEYKGERRKKG
ncbi:MAG: hypothetical protein JXR51_13075 [Bacteroidales bacterium]|nr:hypothetical protein [Bacteroidales bacterium]MBN2758103.1 hypothetical protein [Bacteroidales bacterium]